MRMCSGFDLEFLRILMLALGSLGSSLNLRFIFLSKGNIHMI